MLYFNWFLRILFYASDYLIVIITEIFFKYSWWKSQNGNTKNLELDKFFVLGAKTIRLEIDLSSKIGLTRYTAYILMKRRIHLKEGHNPVATRSKWSLTQLNIKLLPTEKFLRQGHSSLTELSNWKISFWLHTIF